MNSNPVPRPPGNVLGISGSSHTKGYSSGAEDKYRKQSYASHQRSASYQPPQVLYTQPTVTQTSRPPLTHQPASYMAPAPHTSNRYAYVTTGVAPSTNVMMVPAGTQPAYIATSAGVAHVTATAYPAVQRIRQDATGGKHGGAPHVSRSASSDTGSRYRQAGHTAPKVTTPYIPRKAIPPTEPDSDTEDDETYATATAHTNSGYGVPIPSVPKVVSNATGTSAAPTRSSMRKRATSTTSVGTSVHFNPDNLFLTFPTPHTIKLSNVPRFGSQALMRAIREKVNTMWLPGVTFEKEGRGEYIVGFAGLSDAHRAAETGLTEAERKTWGLWTARGAEGIAALRLLTSLFVTFAAQGFSYLATLHSLPPQVIFSTTPSDDHSRFLAIEISVAPLDRKKTKVPVTDADTGELIMTKKVKIDISHVTIRCVDLPDDVLRAVVGAVRNTGRDGAGINHTKKSGTATDYETDIEKKKVSSQRDAGASELLEFGVQGERWDMKGVYVLDSVICRGTGKRGVGRKEIERSRAEKLRHPNMPQVIEADTDTLPVLLGHVLKALSSHGYRLETSIPLPLPVPLVDPFSPFGAHSNGGIGSFLAGVLGGEDDASARRGHGREVWMFRSVGWFEDSE